MCHLCEANNVFFDAFAFAYPFERRISRGSAFRISIWFAATLRTSWPPNTGFTICGGCSGAAVVVAISSKKSEWIGIRRQFHFQLAHFISIVVHTRIGTSSGWPQSWVLANTCCGCIHIDSSIRATWLIPLLCWSSGLCCPNTWRTTE